MATVDRTEQARQTVICTDPVTITYADDGDTIQVAKVPANACIHYILVNVKTAFNDSGNDYLDIGDGADTDRFKNNLDVSSAGLHLIAGGGYKYSSADTIDAIYSGANGDSSAGELTIQVVYSIEDRATEVQE